MSELYPNWDDSKCACVHPDACDCARIRDGFQTDSYRWHKRKCECVCHKFDDDDEDLRL